MELTIIELEAVSFATNRLRKDDVMRIWPVRTSFYANLTTTREIEEMVWKKMVTFKKGISKSIRVRALHLS